MHRDRTHISGYQGEKGGRNEEQLLNGYRAFFWGDENVLELDRGGGCATL